MKARASKSAVALATVVHVEGSAYRRAGARMLIAENGELTGAISGGCLEGETLKKALMVMHQQRSMLVTYDTMDEDDAKLGIGLGCNGIIQVLIEPVDFGDPGNSIDLLSKLVSDRKESVLLTLFSLADKKNVQPGTVLISKQGSKLQGQLSIVKEYPFLIENLRTVNERKESSFKNFSHKNGELTAFFEYIAAPVSLVIAGAGNDVIPLVAMADILGWDTRVMDGRPGYAKTSRFVPSCQVTLSNAEDLVGNIEIDDKTAFLLMTHNYNYDLIVLKSLIKRDVSYIGILGPKKKWAKMQEELLEQGIRLTPGNLAAIHSPVGLNLGAETPEEIALSVIAEIKIAFSGKDAQPLKELDGPIHAIKNNPVQPVTIKQNT